VHGKQCTCGALSRAALQDHSMPVSSTASCTNRTSMKAQLHSGAWKHVSSNSSAHPTPQTFQPTHLWAGPCSRSRQNPVRKHRSICCQSTNNMASKPQQSAHVLHLAACSAGGRATCSATNQPGSFNRWMSHCPSNTKQRTPTLSTTRQPTQHTPVPKQSTPQTTLTYPPA
jgi:hypothetical protein